MNIDNPVIGNCWKLVECKKCGYKFPAPAVETEVGLAFLCIEYVNYCPRCGADIKKLWEEM